MAVDFDPAMSVTDGVDDTRPLGITISTNTGEGVADHWAGVVGGVLPQNDLGQWRDAGGSAPRPGIRFLPECSAASPGNPTRQQQRIRENFWW